MGKKKKNTADQPLKNKSLGVQSVALQIIIISAAILFSYSNSFVNSFQFDDVHYIFENKNLRNFEAFKDINFWFGFGNRAPAQFSLALNYLAGGYDVRGYHIFNVIIHILASVSVFLFVRMLFKSHTLKADMQSKYSDLIALFSALFFAVHPIQTESVTYIVQRMESMSALFYISALVFYLLFRNEERKHSSYFYFLIFIFLSISACITKQTSYTLPLTIMLLEIYFIRDKSGRTNVKIPVFIALSLMIGLIAGLVFGFLPSDPMAGISGFQYLLTQFKVIPVYFRLLILPYGQNIDHAVVSAVSFFELPVILGLAFISGILFLSFHLYKKDLSLMSFSILWIFSVLSLRSSIIPISDFMTERRLYTAVLGMGLFTSSFIFYIKERYFAGRKLLPFIVGLAVGITLLSIATYSRNGVWKTKLTLWQDSVDKSPEKFRPNYNAAEALKEIGQYKKALSYYLKAYSIDPRSYGLCNNIANIYSESKKWAEAERFYKEALELNPGYAKAVLNLGHLYYMTGRTESAAESYRRVLELDPSNSQARNNLEIILNQDGMLNAGQ